MCAARRTIEQVSFVQSMYTTYYYSLLTIEIGTGPGKGQKQIQKLLHWFKYYFRSKHIRNLTWNNGPLSPPMPNECMKHQNETRNINIVFFAERQLSKLKWKLLLFFFAFVTKKRINIYNARNCHVRKMQFQNKNFKSEMVWKREAITPHFLSHPCSLCMRQMRLDLK